MPIKIAVSGACGRVGQALCDAIRADDAFKLALAFEADGSAAIGKATAGGATVQSASLLETCDAAVLIDFTAPAATIALAEVCRRRKIAMVIGTTGFDDAQLAQLRAAGDDTPILVAQNMSVGVNALYNIAAYAAKTLGAGRLGGGYDIEICEEHHRHKKDAPSGTALRLGQALANATGGDFKTDATFARHGADALRGEHDIGYAALRGGDIVGMHRVLFAGEGEQLEITHRATSRSNYVAGALKAARFIAGAKPGFYDGMSEALDSSGS